MKSVDSNIEIPVVTERNIFYWPIEKTTFKIKVDKKGVYKGINFTRIRKRNVVFDTSFSPVGINRFHTAILENRIVTVLFEDMTGLSVDLVSGHYRKLIWNPEDGGVTIVSYAYEGTVW